MDNLLRAATFSAPALARTVKTAERAGGDDPAEEEQGCLARCAPTAATLTTPHRPSKVCPAHSARLQAAATRREHPAEQTEDHPLLITPPRAHTTRDTPRSTSARPTSSRPPHPSPPPPPPHPAPLQAGVPRRLELAQQTQDHPLLTTPPRAPTTHDTPAPTPLRQPPPPPPQLGSPPPTLAQAGERRPALPDLSLLPSLITLAVPPLH